MTAFRRRGFVSSVFQPGDLQAAVAAVEAFIGPPHFRSSKVSLELVQH